MRTKSAQMRILLYRNVRYNEQKVLVKGGEWVLKKLFLIGILLLSPAAGINTAFADELAGNDLKAAAAAGADESNQNVTTAEQTGQDSSGNSNEEPSNTQQSQSTTPKISQNQTVKGDPAPEQDQYTNVAICQQQTTVIIAACQSENTNSNQGTANQSQTADIGAGQQQAVSSNGSANVEQDQETGLASDQNQNITFPSGIDFSQYQNTSIVTDQTEKAHTNANGDFWQEQWVHVFHSQDQLLLGTGTILGEQNQAAGIEASQVQTLNTSDSAKMKQTQEADIQSNQPEAGSNSAEAGVNVKTSNFIKIIKDTSANIVKFVQKIFVNGALADVVKQKYILNENNLSGSTAEQNYQKQFEWGNLEVSNYAEITFNEELQSFTAKLTSTLSLLFNKSMLETSTGKPDQNNDNGTSPDHNGESGAPSEPSDTSSKDSETRDNNETPAAPISSQASSQVTKQGALAIPVKAAEEHTQQVSVKKDQTGHGNQLPNTNTNHYNLLLLGLVLLGFGLAVQFTMKKQRN